jgi:hypothetical protein
MALPWLTILKTVPWTDVINNAPKVADGAKKLWQSVAKKTGQQPPAPDLAQGSTSDAAAETGLPYDAAQVARLLARVATLETTSAELHAQMLSSSELIKTLAEQNAALIKGIEANRARASRLAIACLISLVLAVAALVVAWRLPG